MSKLSDRIRRATWRPVSDASRAAHLASIDDALAAEAGLVRPVVRARRRMSVAVAAAALVVLPTGIALAAENSLPGDVLYPVKKVTETMRSWVDDDVVAEHRVEELEKLVASDASPEVIADQVDRATSEVDRLGAGHRLGSRLDEALVSGHRIVADPPPAQEGGGEGRPTEPAREEPVDRPTTTTTTLTGAIVTDSTVVITDTPTTASTVPQDGPTRTTIVDSPPDTVVPVTRRVAGYVYAGPICPVAQFPPDPACADRPVAGAVLVVVDSDGAEVARVESNGEGRFQVRLPIGSYTLIPQPYEGLLGTAPEQDFTLKEGAILLDVPYDTGIR